ncbi:hypothetical protein IV203_037097 [Nitzschia inconspicua]|uniref:Uncharacterized protein n=1 Tax=Nitzschia inconspicua TaxID=303405 RepID=A0A9K3PYF6_9STRA|nr:hypothetical protein IV203_037097 [Nitzschia inconspicua]
MKSNLDHKHGHYTSNRDVHMMSEIVQTTSFSSFLGVVEKCPTQIRNKSDHTVSTSATEATEDLKFVSFVDRVSVRRTLSLDSYTKEELLACWFTEEEFSRMKKSSMALVAKMNTGSSSVSKYCTRGLEKHTLFQSRQRLKNRYDSICAVLDEQDKLYDEGFSGDDERISRVYSSRTSSSILWAHVVGLHDQKEAEKYL